MRNFLLGLSLSIAFIAGTLFASAAPSAEASSPTYTQCFAASLWPVSGKSLNDGKEPEKVVQIPKGWTPIGGASGTMPPGKEDPFVIVCR